ncbi:MAG: ABC transporter permease [Actinomycetota bacterium]|nr:ABC transporter permease [Actinomycetota bacterium]
MTTDQARGAVGEVPAGSLTAGIADIKAGVSRYQVWGTLTWHSIRSSYRRTYLGPWWITLQTVVFVAGLSMLFGILLDQDIHTFVPYVAIGFIVFTWMTGMIQGGANAIVKNASGITSTPGPMSTYVLEGFASTTIQFGHDAIVIVAVLVLFQVPVGWSIVLVPVALALICINGIAVGLWLGPVVARYRDVGQIVTSIVRVMFFFTPIFWVADDLTSKQQAAIAGWNPLAYLLEFMRAPLLGEWPGQIAVIGTFVITFVNVIVGVWHFSRVHNRIAYWV